MSSLLMDTKYKKLFAIQFAKVRLQFAIAVFILTVNPMKPQKVDKILHIYPLEIAFSQFWEEKSKLWEIKLRILAIPSLHLTIASLYLTILTFFSPQNFEFI